LDGFYISAVNPEIILITNDFLINLNLLKTIFEFNEMIFWLKQNTFKILN